MKVKFKFIQEFNKSFLFLKYLNYMQTTSIFHKILIYLYYEESFKKLKIQKPQNQRNLF